MSKKKAKNSIDTNNPFYLIQSIKLQSKIGYASIKMKGTKFLCLKKNRFIIDTFEMVSENVNDDDLSSIQIRDLLNKIKKFSNTCRNPIEVIELMIDVYKSNKKDFELKITSFPTHRDARDSKFIYDELMNGLQEEN